MTISAYLKRYAEPVTLDELAQAFRTSRRDIEAQVQKERLEGAPLTSDGTGIRYTESPAELRACADRLRHRVVVQSLTARALRRTARRIEETRDLTLGLDDAA